MNKLSVRQKQNQPLPLQQRMSLKKNKTSTKKPQKSQGRMSMLPLKRERTSVAVQNQMSSYRPSHSALQQNNNLLNTIGYSTNQSFYQSNRKSISKQSIISNLVNKLDQQQELRSIIETKLKRNSYGPQKELVYTSDFQPYASNFSSHNNGIRNFDSTQKVKQSQIENQRYETGHQQQENSSMKVKLQKCQQQLAYFKSVVADLSKKVKRWQGEQNKNLCSGRSSFKGEYQKEMKEYIKCSKCNCKKEKTASKILKNIEVQTDPNNFEMKLNQQKDPYESDFFDNLEKTLKILDKSKFL